MTRMSRSPTVSRPRRSDPAGVILSMPANLRKVLGQLFGLSFGGVDQEAAADAAIVFDRLQQLRFVLLAHAGQFADLSFARKFLDAIDVADFVGAPDQRDGLRAQALNLQQLQHRRVVFLQQFGLNGELAVFEEFLQVAQHALADAGDGEHLLGLGDEVFDLLRVRFSMAWAALR